jgi:2-iminobutanoate/2-iminopropanoate deaminase
MAKKQAAFFGGQDTSTGAYSPALIVGDTVYVSGQGPLDPATKAIVAGDIDVQTKRTLDNVKLALEAAGCSMNDCVKLTVHLSDIANFEAFNAIYKTYFDKPFPARTTVQSVLHGHIRIEIDAIAVKGAAG